MRIGVDIDGTINNFADIASKYIELETGFKWDRKQYEIYPKMNADEIHNFMLRHRQDFIDEVQPVNNSQDCIRNLLNARNQVYFITARDYVVAEDTLQWLRKHGFLYTDIFFNCGDKVGACIWKDIDVMIDDSPYNIKKLEENHIPYIVFNQPYNQNINDGLYRATNWNEIENFIRQSKTI